MSRGREGHGLERLVFSLALILAGIVLYHVGLRLLRKAVEVPVPDKAPSAVSSESPPVHGSSGIFETVSEMPPIRLERSGRKGGKSKSKVPAPPVPK